MLLRELKRQNFRVVSVANENVFILAIANLNGDCHLLRCLFILRWSALFIHSESLSELGGLIWLLTVRVNSASVVEGLVLRHISDSVHH